MAMSRDQVTGNNEQLAMRNEQAKTSKMGDGARLALVLALL